MIESDLAPPHSHPCGYEQEAEDESTRPKQPAKGAVGHGKMKRAREYFGEPFEAPEWRAQWVERA